MESEEDRPPTVGNPRPVNCVQDESSHQVVWGLIDEKFANVMGEYVFLK